MSTFDQPSAFESILRYLGRPQKMVLNALSGNAQGVANQAIDLVGDTIDAILPGDWIKERSKEQDNPDVSDLIGGMKPGLAKSVIDILGGVALDPLTYAGGVGLLSKGIKSGLSAAKGAAETTATGRKVVSGVQSAADKIRIATGNTREAPEVKEAINKGLGTEDSVLRATQDYALHEFKDVSPDILNKSRLLISDVVEDPNVGYKTLGIRSANRFGTHADQMQLIDARLNLTGWDDVTKTAVRDYLSKATNFSMTQFNRGAATVGQGGRGVFERNIDPAQYAGKNVDELAPLDYHPRGWDVEDSFEGMLKKGVSPPNMLRQRSITTPEEFVGKLNEFKENGTSPFSTDSAAQLWGKYAEQTARASKQAKIADELATFGSYSPVADKKLFSSEVSTIIDDYRKKGDLDSASVLETNFYGMAKREGLPKALAWFNNAFKPFATAGAFIPRVAFNTRNAVSSAMQVASNPQARKALMEYLPTIPTSVVDGGKAWLNQLGLTNFSSRFDRIKDAAIKAKGDESLMLDIIRNGGDSNLAAALERGVISKGFISTEGKIAKESTYKSLKDWKNLRDAPQEWTHTTEQTMRLGLFDSLLKKGIDADSAAGIVEDSFYNYRYTSAANRTIRDFVPFSQFTMKAVPQFAKLATEDSLAGRATVPFARELFTQGDDAHPLPQWLANQPTIPLGGENGTSSYLTGLGLPFEVAAGLPNPSDDIALFGRQAEQGIVSQLNPALKFAYSAVAGHDPYFGSDFNSYDKTPDVLQAFGAPDRSDAARYYNLAASTGLTQPISAPLNILNSLTNDKKSTLQALLDVLGPVKTATVDDQSALQSRIYDYLKSDPHVKEYRAFYTKTDDEDTLAAIEELKKIKREMRKNK